MARCSSAEERPLTEHVHLAFPAQDDATARSFHVAALAAGYEDHGGPGERAVYHPTATAGRSARHVIPRDEGGPDHPVAHDSR